MERKQFKFTGLTWMKPEEIQKVRKQLLKLEDYGIEFEFVLHNDAQLFIYDYDEILQSPNDEGAVTFTKKFKNSKMKQRNPVMETFINWMKIAC